MKDLMRVILLNYEFPPIGGGAGKANKCLLAEFAGVEDLEIDVLTSSTTPGLTVEEFADNITIYKVGIRKKNLHYWKKSEVISWLFKAYFQYRKMVGDNDYDLAHAFFGFPTGFLPWLTAGKLPYIISLRGSDVPGYNIRLGLDYKLLGGLFSSIWHRSSAVIANSRGLADLASKFTPDIEIGIIPNGVYKDRFFPEPNKDNKGKINLLTVCRLISRKRLHLLIETTALLVEKGLDVRLTIAGEGNLLNDLKSCAGKNKVSGRVDFLGLVSPSNMPAIYRENDIFVMCSSHEGMSNAMLEAMASGLAVVTTPCEGVAELIKDNGIIVEETPGKNLPEDIADAISQLYSTPDRIARMSTASVERAGQFTWAAAADRYIAQYRVVANSRGAKS